MAATATARPSQVQRDENIARVANQAAETALAHLFHVNGHGLVPSEVFDPLQVELRNVLMEQLFKSDIRALVRAVA